VHMVHSMCVVHGRACLPIPHSTYHRRPTVPQSHRSQTAIIWPPSLPPRLLYPCKRVNSTSAKPISAPAPAPPHLPSHKTGLASPCHFLTGVETTSHTLTPNFVSYSSPTLLRPSSTLYRAPSQSIVTMRGSAWIEFRPRPNHRADSRPGTKPVIASSAPLSPVRPGQKCQVR
jgi:hypothetical protein